MGALSWYQCGYDFIAFEIGPNAIFLANHGCGGCCCGGIPAFTLGIKVGSRGCASLAFANEHNKCGKITLSK